MSAGARREERDRLARATFEVRSIEGVGLGTGVLVESQRVLTCSHVISDLKRVKIADESASEPICGAKVERWGNPEGPDDLAMLFLDQELLEIEPMRFVGWRRLMEFAAIGFPEGKDHVSGKVHGPADLHGWLDLETSSRREIEEGFSGGAVWSPLRQAAVGLITHYLPGDGKAYAIPTAQILEFFPVDRDQRDPEERCASQIANLRQQLERSEVQQAIFSADPSWQKARDQGEDLARLLCLETEPVDLASQLGAVYRSLIRHQRRAVASEVFEVLMNALPASMLTSWRMDVPGISDIDIELGLRHWVLTDMALAISEGGSACFEEEIKDPESNFPRARHRLPRPVDLGPDPKGRERAGEVAKEVRLRLALPDGSPESLQRATRYLSAMAARKPGPEEPLLLDRDYMSMTEPETGADLEVVRQALLDDIDRFLQRELVGTGRKLYFGADREERDLAESLRELLPNLRIITQSLPLQHHKDVSLVLRHLAQVFSARPRTESEKPRS